MILKVSHESVSAIINRGNKAFQPSVAEDEVDGYSIAKCNSNAKALAITITKGRLEAHSNGQLGGGNALGIFRNNSSHVNGSVAAITTAKDLVNTLRVHEEDAIRVAQETDVGSSACINTGLEDWVGRAFLKTKGKTNMR